MGKVESRIKNSSRNIIFSVIAYIVQIILGFVVRRNFIYYFGTEYLGINSLFSNVLSILSLAELGFGSAIVFAMYKPMADGDTEKVRELLQYYKKAYYLIGTVVFCVGLLILPFMDYFKQQAAGVDINLYIVYIIFLVNSVISYFFAHRRSLLYTNQRNDIESKVNMVLNLLSTVLQLLIIFFIQNYYLYIMLLGIISLVNNVFIYFVTQKMYPEYLKKPTKQLDADYTKSINKNVKSLIYHKIGSTLVFSTDNLIIFMVLGSMVLGKYSNYQLIISYVTSFLMLIVGAIRGSVGNYIASEPVEKNNKLYSKINFIYMWIVSFCTVCIFCLSDAFIDTVLTKQDNITLVLDKEVLICLCVSFFLTCSRHITSLYKECVGLFYQDRYKSIIEAAINLLVSILLALQWGLIGVIIGTIVSTVVVPLWIEPFILNKHYMHKSTTKYFLKYSVFVFATVVATMITYFVCSKLPTGGIFVLVSKFAICAILPNIIFLLIFAFVPEFKECVSFVKDILFKVIGKRKVKVAVVSTKATDVNNDGIHEDGFVNIIVDTKTNELFESEIKKEQE